MESTMLCSLEMYTRENTFETNIKAVFQAFRLVHKSPLNIFGSIKSIKVKKKID